MDWLSLISNEEKGKYLQYYHIFTVVPVHHQKCRRVNKQFTLFERGVICAESKPHNICTKKPPILYISCTGLEHSRYNQWINYKKTSDRKGGSKSIIFQM